LGTFYRDWLSVRDDSVSAYPSAETMLKYQRWAGELVVGGAREREGRDFRRFCRIQLEGKMRGLVDLAMIGDLYDQQKVDFPAPKGWACLRETDEHFANRSWESGWKPLRVCVRCGREPGPDDKAQEIGGWLRLCGSQVYLCPDCRADLNAYRDRQIKSAKRERKRKQSKLPNDIPDTIEVDLGRFRGWVTVTAERVKGRWLHYRLPDGQMSKVQTIGRDMLWRIPAVT
ncbi:MAG: hypothetical protein GY832_18895, partial [Chloroflexi bacterium]|nr:hypothetical protein [Chloroflexota bacterium]